MDQRSKPLVVVVGEPAISNESARHERPSKRAFLNLAECSAIAAANAYGGTTPFRGEKNTNWEGGYRVPCLVRWPGVIKPGTVINDIVAHEDWVPTLMAAAGEPMRPGGITLRQMEDGLPGAASGDSRRQQFTLQLLGPA